MNSPRTRIPHAMLAAALSASPAAAFAEGLVPNLPAQSHPYFGFPSPGRAGVGLERSAPGAIPGTGAAVPPASLAHDRTLPAVAAPVRGHSNAANGAPPVFSRPAGDASRNGSPSASARPTEDASRESGPSFSPHPTDDASWESGSRPSKSKVPIEQPPRCL